MIGIIRKKFLTRALLVALSLAAPWSAFGQSGSNQPLRVIVPFPAGGAMDTFARGAGRLLSEAIQRPVVVENRVGAGGLIGLDAAARAEPDGNTLFVTVTSIEAINPALLKDTMKVDPAVAFTPVALLATLPNVLVVNPSVPARNVKELVAYLKANSSSVNFGSFGVGTTTRVGWARFEQAIGTKALVVPYKGDAAMLLDLAAGRVQISLPTVTAAAPFVRDGRLRALAVTGSERSSVLPSVPTIAEAGFPGLEVTTWFAISAPSGTPATLISQYNAALNRAMATPEMQQRLHEYGATSQSLSPDALREFIAAERKKWTQIIVSAGITPE